jgi:hypothetical protein
VKLVIIESPYKGETERNLRYLRSCIRDCLSRGESPYASHRMLTDALDDNSPAERALGIEAGLAWRNVSGVLPVFYVDLGWSNGMWEAQAVYDDEERFYEIRLLPKDNPFFKEVAPTLPPPPVRPSQPTLDETPAFHAEGEVPK